MVLSFNKFTQTICSVQTDISKELLHKIKNIKLKEGETQSTNYGSISLLDDAVYQEAFNYLKTYLLQIMRYYKYSSYRLINYWSQSYNHHEYHELHTHNMAANHFSCILYIQCDKDSAPTRFHPPGYPYIFSTEPIDLLPEVGRLVVFPGYIPHAVLPNKDNIRLIISANLEGLKDGT